MSSNVDSTLSVIDTGGGSSADDASAPALFVLLEASRPWAGSTRHILTDIDRVELGRGSARAAVREGRTLRITLPDRWMSSRHATIENRLGRWLVSDKDSKNGTSVNGVAVRSELLGDGALIGVGHTLLRLRSRLPGALREPIDTEHVPESGDHPAFATLIPALAAELAQAARLATAADIPFLIHGESGTGKEVLASAVHELSGRPGDLVAVNCGAIPANLVESELFGHVRGAFSGALTDKIGLIRSADGGTLLLDEIGDLALSSQTALLRVLQEREVHPVGAARPVAVDLRVLSATHRDLDDMVARGDFRGDLYARLAGYSVSLLPLRERADDLGILIASLFRRIVEDWRAHPGLSIEVAQSLVSHRWPMNIRELEAAMRAALALAGGDAVAPEHLSASVRAARSIEAPSEDDTLRALLETKLREHRGNVSAVARDVGKDRKQIQRWLKRFELEADDFR